MRGDAVEPKMQLAMWKNLCIFSCKAVTTFFFFLGMRIQEEGEYCPECSWMSTLTYWARHLFIDFIYLCVLCQYKMYFHK